MNVHIMLSNSGKTIGKLKTNSTGKVIKWKYYGEIKDDTIFMSRLSGTKHTLNILFCDHGIYK